MPRPVKGFAQLSLLAWGFVLLGVLGFIGTAVYRIHEAGKDEVLLEWSKASAAQRAKEQKQGNAAADKKEKGDAKAKVVYRTITKEVDRVVVEYRDRACLDPDGLRLARAAIRGEVPDPAQPDKPLRPAPGPERRDSGLSLALDRRGF